MTDPFRFTTIGHAGRALLGPLSPESVDGLLAGITLRQRALLRPRGHWVLQIADPIPGR